MQHIIIVKTSLILLFHLNEALQQSSEVGMRIYNVGLLGCAIPKLTPMVNKSCKEEED